jgi:hypothetical protein
MIRQLFILPAVAIPLLVGLAVGEEKITYPKLHAALYELREAKKELTGIKGDVGGHKKKALTTADDAICSTNLILVVGSEETSPIKRNKDFYKKWKDYPRARAALEALREARVELQKTKGDFQGNKKRALRKIEVATDEIRALLDALR